MVYKRLMLAIRH